ncbi:MAG TPA: transposase, partial [Bradyrhizobium sp.]
MGVMDRLVLSDAAWERMAPLIIGRPDQKGSTERDNRMFVEGVLWIVRTGSPWRDPGGQCWFALARLPPVAVEAINISVLDVLREIRSSFRATSFTEIAKIV